MSVRIYYRPPTKAGRPADHTNNSVELSNTRHVDLNFDDYREGVFYLNAGNLLYARLPEDPRGVLAVPFEITAKIPAHHSLRLGRIALEEIFAEITLTQGNNPTLYMSGQDLDAMKKFYRELLEGKVEYTAYYCEPPKKAGDEDTDHDDSEESEA